MASGASDARSTPRPRGPGAAFFAGRCAVPAWRARWRRPRLPVPRHPEPTAAASVEGACASADAGRPPSWWRGGAWASRPGACSGAACPAESRKGVSSVVVGSFSEAIRPLPSSTRATTTGSGRFDRSLADRVVRSDRAGRTPARKSTAAPERLARAARHLSGTDGFLVGGQRVGHPSGALEQRALGQPGHQGWDRRRDPVTARSAVRMSSGRTDGVVCRTTMRSIAHPSSSTRVASMASTAPRVSKVRGPV